MVFVSTEFYVRGCVRNSVICMVVQVDVGGVSEGELVPGGFFFICVCVYRM